MTPQEISLRKKQEAAGDERTRPGRAYVPEVDICETKDSLWLWADLPGVDEKSISIKLEDGVLAIDGHVSLEAYDKLKPLYTEYNVGNYARRFTVSEQIDANRITARIVNGVLELQLPKSAAAQPRRISVATA
jgi:HSP20 family molecular chaperone IbpA